MPIDTLLTSTAHRPWPLPGGRWKYYQEWNKALFLHWEIDAALIQPFLPPATTLDTFEGKAWLSIVAFTMQKIRPRHLPFFKPVSDFHEVNVRTYVIKDGKSGVYFLSLEAQKMLSVFISRNLSALPYQKASIRRSKQSHSHMYSSINIPKQFRLHAVYDIVAQDYHKTALDRFLTERYCAYVDKKGVVYRYDIHHPEWPVQPVTIRELELQYKIGNIHITTDTPPQLAHYSSGVKVVAWGKEKVV